MPVTLQPTSLKYKDSNGVFQNATAIQGESPVVAVADITGGHRITITDADGAHSFDVMDGDAADAPVQSVNGQTGAVVLDAADVGAGTYSKPSGGIPASDLAAGVIPTVPVQDVQVNGVSVLQDGVANVPIADANNPGVVKVNSSKGIGIDSNGALTINRATSGQIKSGSNGTAPITTYVQHESTFYGLAKAAGDATQSSSSNTVGTYTDSAKASIQHMLGTDTNLADYESDTTADAAYAIGELFMLNGKLHQATTAIAIGDTFTVGTNCAVVSAVEVFPHDVQVNGTSIVQNGVANMPIATSSNVGVVKAGSSTAISGSGTIEFRAVGAGEVKAGTSYIRALTPERQHASVFYGLAKAAGADMASSSNAIGTYTDAAKSAISEMLNGAVSVTGTTPTITALPGIRYVCGEVATLSFTPSATGICDVTFTSGSTATTLTVPNTVKWPEWFDPTSLEANMTYELNVMDGIYGAVGVWS